MNALVSEGSYLFSGSQDGTVRQWDAKTYDCIKIFRRADGLKAWVSALACNGNTLIAGYVGDRGRFSTLQGWSLGTGQALAPFSDCINDVNALAIVGEEIVTAHSFRAGIGQPSLAIHSLVTGRKTAAVGGVDGVMLDLKYYEDKLYGAGGEGVLGVVVGADI